MVTDDLQPLALEKRDAAEHLLPDRRVRLHQAPLLVVQRPALVQDRVGDPDLAHVVKEAHSMVGSSASRGETARASSIA